MERARFWYDHVRLITVSIIVVIDWLIQRKCALMQTRSVGKVHVV